ncbi:hypothetical protein [Anaerocolumna jejuensis]|nr:hypothetical protein [Anaerocolumna jejuensis]
MNKSKDFNSLVSVIRMQGEARFEEATPVVVITLNKPIRGNLLYQCDPSKYHFKAGEQFVYISGERSGQRSAWDFFENCEGIDDLYLEDLEIYFAECFPVEEIFENPEFATYEDFPW